MWYLYGIMFIPTHETQNSCSDSAIVLITDRHNFREDVKLKQFRFEEDSNVVEKNLGS